MPPSAPHHRLSGRVGDAERRFVLGSGEYRVGSAEGNDILLPVSGVSREHAVLRSTAEGLEIEDLGSRNGTFVDDRRIETAGARPGDTIAFGPVALALETLDPGDAELALVLDGSPRREPTPLPPDQSTTDLHRRRRPAEAAEGLDFPPGYLPGHSPAAAELYRQLRALAPGSLPILIVGETGSGKEPTARTLHLSSPRRHRPFVAINCAAVPRELLEAELFGIGEGVATGVRGRPGKFRLAQGGTLLLDEIGDMPLDLQAKLLRALQEKEIQPLGRAAEAIDVRTVAATNADLEARIGAGEFRRDLYYRLAGAVVRVPSLAERHGDLPGLIEFFLRRATAEAGKRVRGLSRRALEKLVDYPWPGNVRELEHEIRRLVLLCPEDEAIDSSLLEKCSSTPSQAPGSLRLRDHVQEAERRAIVQALEEAGGSQRRAAQLLGIARNTLARKIAELEIPV